MAYTKSKLKLPLILSVVLSFVLAQFLFFGFTNTASAQTPPLCPDGASIAIYDLPATLYSGQTYTFRVRATNTGTSWWYHGGVYQLYQTSNLSINSVAPFAGLNYGHLEQRPGPGEYQEWTFTITAPTTGSYSLSFQMVHTLGPGDGEYEWFDPNRGEKCGDTPASVTYFSSPQGTQALSVVAPPPPTNVSSSCPGTGTTASTSWTLPSGFSLSYLRVYNYNTSSYVAMVPEWSADNGPSFSFSSTPGYTYTSWVYTRATNGQSSDPVGSTFTCNKTPTINSISVSPNPVPYGATTSISFTSSNAYYCYVLMDGVWDWNDQGYFTGGAHTTPALTSPGNHTAWVYCYNSDWVGSGWSTVPFTVNYLPTVDSISVSPNPVPYGATTSISFTSSHGYYSYVLIDGSWAWSDGGYFTGGSHTTPAQTSPGAHTAWVYVYNSDWAGSGWSTTPFTVGNAPINGGWSDWSSCSVSCGGGTRTRTCTNPTPQYGGNDCNGPSSQSCNNNPCQIDGGWSGWSGWGSCSTSTCGDTGTEISTRTCTNPVPQYGGAYCSGSDTQSQSCDAPACTCPNGANNPPTCTTNNGVCIDSANNPPTCTVGNIKGASTCVNGATNPPGCTNACGNGATNPPTCTTGVTACGNGANNPPTCTIGVGTNAVNGKCSNNHYYCFPSTSGSSAHVGGVSTWSWTCSGLGGGTSEACNEPKKVPVIKEN